MNRSVAGLLTSKTTKWIALVFWIAVVALSAPLAQKLTGAQQNDAISWLPGDAESTRALTKLEVFQDPNELPTVVVYERPEGLTDADVAKATEDARAFADLEGVEREVQGPIPSEDGQALQTVVPLNLGPNGWEKAVDIVDEMRATANAGDDGLTAYITGPGGMAADSGKAFEGIDGTLLFSTITVVIIILLVTYRSPVLWLLPVVSAGFALMVAQAVIYLLAEHRGLVVNAQSAGILTVLVFGAGTDYALLLVARYREELRRHSDRHAAMAVALHRAGPAILASAGTVIAGMLCLVFAETNSTQGLGPVAAIGVAVGLLVMITLLPALLVICGRWIFWPYKPQLGSPEPTATGMWARVGTRIAQRPRAVWVTTSVILAVACIGLVKLDATGLTTEEQYTTTVDSVTGEEVLSRHFDAGASDPVSIVANADAAEQVTQAVTATDGVAAAAPTADSDGVVFVQATLSDAPDSPEAYDTIDRLRDSLQALPEADALVTGTTAIQLDVQRAAQADENLIIPIILVVVFLILAVLLRAIVAPLLLIATVVLSFGAALGISALIFDYILGFGGADSSLPLFVFVFLVALGIDYNIFLMTRVREEALTYGTRRGALVALAATGGVITSAGVVLAGTFAVLATLPLVAFAEIGVAVALGVLLDTIIVRSVLVTAMNLDFGRRMWWPSQLGHKPDIDVESIRESSSSASQGSHQSTH
ncbi:MAG TPA: MMPL family transporter [Nocardioidaceae bacterium]|nr:MMPL family transporter [Nocardioidaceae bacterium]